MSMDVSASPVRAATDIPLSSSPPVAFALHAVHTDELAEHEEHTGGDRGFFMENGRIFKPIQDHHYLHGRGLREKQFYNLIFGLPQSHAPAPCPYPCPGHSHSDEFSLEQEPVRAAVPWHDLVKNDLVCHYHGVVVIDNHNYMAFEDLSAGYERPSMMDIKMGVQTFDEDVSEDERRIRVPKDAKTTSVSCGYRICGMKVYQHNGSVVRLNRKAGARFTRENVWERGLLPYFAVPNFNPEACRQAISQVERIQDYFIQKGQYRFYAASILFVYEGTPGRNPALKARVIDFAHWHENAPGVLDRGFLFGLANLLSAFHSLLHAYAPLVPRPLVPEDLIPPSPRQYSRGAHHLLATASTSPQHAEASSSSASSLASTKTTTTTTTTTITTPPRTSSSAAPVS